jgi:hypothetical protein
VTATLVALHIASHAEGLATPCLRTFVRLFTGVAVAVNAQTARPREGLVAGGANVPILRLGES